MSRAITAEATWDGDVPRLDDPQRYRKDAKAQRWHVGQRLMVKLAPVTRSERANAYYWGVVLEHIERLSESGYTADELHDVFCERFIQTDRKRVEFFNRMTGEVLITEFDHRRSSALSGLAFYEFVEQVRQFALEFWNVQTPDPDPEYWRKPRHERRAAKAA